MRGSSFSTKINLNTGIKQVDAYKTIAIAKKNGYQEKIGLGPVDSNPLGK